MAPPYRIAFRPTAFRRLLALSPDERNEAIAAIESLRADPSPDEVRRRALQSMSELALCIYDGDLVWVTYRRVDGDVVSILTVMPRRAQP